MEYKKFFTGALAGVSSFLSLTGVTFAQAVDLSVKDTSFPNKASGMDLVAFLVRMLFVVGGLLMLVYLILGGIRYITSGGDKVQAQGARDMITHALIGIIIIASSYAVAMLLKSLLGIDVFKLTINSAGTINPAP